ncbi:MAG TPA: tetratricopeptide repeat protein, partial [Longimicrobiaceae bacterium]|nr:tetratricopeptide repeat protein [Longimicrobiaceae bacterium]
PVPAAQSLAAGPAPQTASPAVAAPGAPASPAAGAAPAGVPGAADAAAAAAAPAVVSAAEDSRTYVQILEPREWSGATARGIMLAPRSSLRVVGLAQHVAGVARIEVNGVRAAFSPDPNGGHRFVAYVPADPTRRDVEVIVRGNTGPPLVKHFDVEPMPAPVAALAAAAGAPAAPAPAPVGAFKGRRWAVVVGVSQFQDRNITALRYADADARAFYQFLRSPRAGGGGFPEENVKLLINEQATYREIRSALFTFLKGATEDDEVVVYFAGHGAPDPQRLQNLYLLTYDTDLADISSSAFPMDDVNKAIHSLYAHDVVVITDACHSAGVGGQLATRDLGTNGINDVFLQQLSASTGGLAIFTASGANQQSLEDPRWGGGHGVFTHYLLEGLNGSADEDGDRIVSLSEMMEYARAKVRVDTRNQQIPTISQTAFDPYLPMAIVDASFAAAPAAALPVPAAMPAPGASRETAPRPAAMTPQQADAIARFQDAVRLYPRSALYRRNLGVALREAGRSAEALAELQEAARLDAGNADFVYELGLTLRALSRDVDAVAQFEAAVRMDGRNGAYVNALGNVLLTLGRKEEALDRLRRAVGIQRDNAAFHRDLAAALTVLERPADAVNELRQAVQVDARNAGYHMELAQALDGSGRAGEALPEYQQATVMEPTSAAFKAAYARALAVAGRPAEATEQLKAAVQIDGRNADYRHSLGMLMREQGMPYEMLVEFREAARLVPASAMYRYDLGMALAGSNQAPAAVVELKEAVRLEPDNAKYQNSLGTVLKAAGSPQEALAALREAVKAAPDTASYHYDLAIMLRDLGMIEDAIAELESATRLDGRNREYRTELSSLRNRSRGG